MLLIAAALLVAFAFLIWIFSVIVRDASIIDRFWGIGFVVVCGAGLVWAGAPTLHQWLVAGLVTIWGVRLAGHITWRNWGSGEDYRYQAMREKHGRAFWWKSLFIVFLLQAFLTWFIALPLQLVFAAEGPVPLSPLIWVGVSVFAVGFLFEAVGDWQLARFKANPDNKGLVMDRGLWRYTRHPNYFGDALLWWGLFLVALPAPYVAYTILSPVVMTVFLMKVSGVPLTEKRMAETRPAYAEYVRKTPAFLPWWPRA